jgi:ribosomal protein S18 acetylase RimI-like enzyme
MDELLKIRKYEPHDLEKCRSLWKELVVWHREIYQDQKIGGINPEEYFDNHLDEVGPELIWVAIKNAQIVGFIGLIMKDPEADIEPLIVGKAFRGEGIGEQLIQTDINHESDRVVRFLNVKPVARNIDAIKFFHKQGFRKIGHIELFIDFSDYKWKKGPELFGCSFDY